jgi:hypothetical protein
MTTEPTGPADARRAPDHRDPGGTPEHRDPYDDDRLDLRLARLVAMAGDVSGDDEQRREPLVERGEERGVSRGLAERAYDLAVEEHLPPAYGIAVVAAGVSVQPLDSPRPDVGATAGGEPDWVDPPPPAREADLERRLRQTFRRLRSHLEDAPTPRAALEGFAREPDLEPFDY